MFSPAPKTDKQIYLSELSAIVNRTGNIAALEAEAGRIATERNMIRENVLNDLQRMRRVAVAEAIREV